MLKDYIFTSESVSEGHPDKIADQISDAILDAVLAQDKNAKVALETLLKSNQVILAGEMSTHAQIDIESIVRKTIHHIGYDKPELGFDSQSCVIKLNVTQQSLDIARGVELDKKLGAGDQGLMFGYACSETPTLMPAPIFYAHRLMERQAALRKSKAIEWLYPDAKSQISLEYKKGVPYRIDAVVLSTQHAPTVSIEKVREAVMESIIKPVLPKKWLDNKTRVFINPTGRFVVGGPVADAGLTGRKIIVDTYGGMARHGGGCFSGKDPSKVDRSGAYMARKIAKNIVAAQLAERCEVQIAYTIGVPTPTALYINTFETGKIPEFRLVQLVEKYFALDIAGMINTLDLLHPIYQKTASYGHFGRLENGFTWEYLDKIDVLSKEA